MRNKQSPTSRTWNTEEEATKFLLDRIQRTGVFHVYQEVKGFWLQPPAQLAKSQLEPRIDLILSPTQKLLDLGWELGDIGVECKRSGFSVGKAVRQAMLYRRCAFTLIDKDDEGNVLPISETNYGQTVVLTAVWVWPSPSIGGDVASIAAQNRVHTLRHRLYPATTDRKEIDIVRFHFCGSHLLSLYSRGKVEFNRGNGNDLLASGLKGPCG